MIRHLNEQREKQKEEINKENDDYFAILESSSSEEGFDINKIEQLMLERRKKLKETLDKADSEMTSNVEAPIVGNSSFAGENVKQRREAQRQTSEENGCGNKKRVVKMHNSLF